MNDWMNYSPQLVTKLSGASAALWCMGSPSAGRDVTVEYSMAAANMCAEKLAPQSGKGFTFIFLSGALVEQDQTRTLWFLPQARKMRGELELMLVDLEKETVDAGFKSVLVRPSAVTKSKDALMTYAMFGWWIAVQELAAAMVKVATSGATKNWIENDELRQIGQKALEESPWQA